MKNNLNVYYWDTTDGNFQFPELNQASPMYYNALEGRASSGICISGGGTVSASLIAGYFKALVESGLMDRVSYISGVSGGCWGSAPFAFMRDLEDKDFYAAVCAPGDYVAHIEEAIGKKTWVEVNPLNSMTHVVTNAPIADLTLKNLAFMHEAYSRAVGTIFLQPFNIPSPVNPLVDQRRYFTTDENTLEDIKDRNGDISNDDVLVMVPNRPYLIMNTTMLIPTLAASKKFKDYAHYLFEFTPGYCGMFAAHGNYSGINLGGSYLETIGFNTNPVAVSSDLIQTESDYRFELCQPVGTSGSAIEEMILKKNNLEDQLANFLPAYNYWNPTQFVAAPETVQADTIYFGDGGIIENTGIISLLLRGLSNVAAFLSEPVCFGDANAADVTKYEIFGYNQIACLFGEKIWYRVDDNSPYQLVADIPSRQVFDNTPVGGITPFQQLLQSFIGLRNQGKALVQQQTLTVIANSLFGVKGGYNCNVVWSIIDTCTLFNEALAHDISDRIGKDGDLKNFPKVKVFDENEGEIIQLKAIQANLLGSLAYWMVETNMATYFNVLNAGEVVKKSKVSL